MMSFSNFGNVYIFFLGVVFSVFGIPNWLLYACLLDIWTLFIRWKSYWLFDVCNGNVIRCLWCRNCIPKQYFDVPRVSKSQGFNPMFALYSLGPSRCRDFIFQCATWRRNMSAWSYFIFTLLVQVFSCAGVPSREGRGGGAASLLSGMICVHSIS